MQNNNLIVRTDNGFMCVCVCDILEIIMYRGSGRIKRLCDHPGRRPHGRGHLKTGAECQPSILPKPASLLPLAPLIPLDRQVTSSALPPIIVAKTRLQSILSIHPSNFILSIAGIHFFLNVHT